MTRISQLLLGSALLLAALVAPAEAQASFLTGVDDTNLYTSPDSSERDRWFDTTTELDAGIVRLDLVWSRVAGAEPADPTDPSDPAYDFSTFDAAIQDAAERNLQVVLTIFGAPGFAQLGGEPASAANGAWKPDPQALGAFAEAVATRYSGTFEGLPHVRYYEAWNEANLGVFLAPQYEGGREVAVGMYRRMLNSVEKAVASVDDDNLVIAGSLAPYGDPPGGHRTHPLTFLRALLCLNDDLKKTGCPVKPEFDILSHHPINLSGPPRQSALDPDDASSPDMGDVGRILRAAERAGTIAGNKERHPLWVTEYWWESFPDGPHAAIPGLKKHGLWIEEALYLFWKAGAKAAIYFTLQDAPFDAGDASATLQAGLYQVDGTPKPAATAFRFPFVTERTGGDRVRAWGKSPATGKLLIERKAGDDWRRVDSENVNAGEVFTAKLSLSGRATLRASVGGDHSLPWSQGRG